MEPQLFTPEFKKERTTCANVALALDGVPPIDNSFTRSQDETIQSNLSFPATVSWRISAVKMKTNYFCS